MKTGLYAVSNPLETARRLAKMLDDRLEKLEDFDGRKCLKRMSPYIRDLLMEKEVSDTKVALLASHILLHVKDVVVGDIEEARKVSWRRFYDALVWNAISNLVAIILDPSRAGYLAYRLSFAIVTLDDAIGNPELYHLNRNLDTPCFQTNERLDEIAKTAPDRVAEVLRAIGVREL